MDLFFGSVILRGIGVLLLLLVVVRSSGNRFRSPAAKSNKSPAYGCISDSRVKFEGGMVLLVVRRSANDFRGDPDALSIYVDVHGHDESVELRLMCRIVDILLLEFVRSGSSNLLWSGLFWQRNWCSSPCRRSQQQQLAQGPKV